MNNYKRAFYYFTLFTVLMLIAAGAACNAPADSPGADEEANLVITEVSLSTDTPAVEEWVTVEVTVQNQGTAVVTGYELVLISHYGDGPPNPSGLEPLPDLAPGATHTVSFEPGLLYMNSGPAIVRVLATDTWYALGDADSTGEAGDYLDTPITVSAAPAAQGPNLVITAMNLSNVTPAVEEFVTVEVTVENKGTAVVTGYELVLIAHYGDGPPNPSGVESLPDLAPGATHTITFQPGLFYVNAGPATVRVLATDTWYALGDAESTGEAGDYRDVPVTIK